MCSAREEKGFVLVCHLTGEKWGLREQAWCRQTTSRTARATVGPGAREREWGGVREPPQQSQERVAPPQARATLC